MSRGANSQLAVDMYETLRIAHSWGSADAWKGIAFLLLTCEKWVGAWRPFLDCVVYRESNDFKLTRNGHFGTVIQRAQRLTSYLGSELGITGNVCAELGMYWRNPLILSSQPHNLVGHAFRSIVLEILKRYGDPGIAYEEEVSPHVEFPGYPFPTRSAAAKIDIVARRGNLTVALISARWRYRHDRVDVVDEALAYVPAGRRAFPRCAFYAMVGEFNPARLLKILDHTPPTNPNGVVSAAVHFCPDLILNGLGENGRMRELKNLDWLIAQTYTWR